MNSVRSRGKHILLVEAKTEQLKHVFKLALYEVAQKVAQDTRLAPHVQIDIIQNELHDKETLYEVRPW